MKRSSAFLWIFLSLTFQILSLGFGKAAALRTNALSLLNLGHNGPYLASLLCLACQAITWPLALRRFPLFWAYLFMSGLYLAIPMVSRFYFHEPLTGRNLIGSLVILAGIVLLLAGGKEASRG
jgi:multidrug transporter EmrE-like cation transporter